MKESPKCPHCHRFTEPVFHPRAHKLMAWICSGCTLDNQTHWFCPPTGTTWEQELTPDKWAVSQNVVSIDYRTKKNETNQGAE
jgi:hypothetical protein